MARCLLTAKAMSNRSSVAMSDRFASRRRAAGRLGTIVSTNPFRLQATRYGYRWPGTAPASTRCPREGAGPCPSIMLCKGQCRPG
jgi:hypothetical protein